MLLLAIIKTIIIFKAYKNFKNVFSIKNAGYLFLHKDYNNAINLINNKQSSYKPIYSLSKNKLSIFEIYINKNLANRFIRPSKSFFGAFILFMPKPNKGLRLYIDYQGLHNLIIKN